MDFLTEGRDFLQRLDIGHTRFIVGEICSLTQDNRVGALSDEVVDALKQRS